MPIVALEASARHPAGTNHLAGGKMLSAADREQFALDVMDEVHRWPGVEMRAHAGMAPGESDGVEFRLNGRQIGHVHSDCAVHVPLTKALQKTLIAEQLAEPLPHASTSGWATFNPGQPADAQRAIWLFRLNYVRLRRQRLTPAAAASSELLRHHEAELAAVSSAVTKLVQRTQARSKPRPMPGFDTPLSGGPSISNAAPPA